MAKVGSMFWHEEKRSPVRGLPEKAMLGSLLKQNLARKGEYVG